MSKCPNHLGPRLALPDPRETNWVEMDPQQLEGNMSNAGMKSWSWGILAVFLAFSNTSHAFNLGELIEAIADQNQHGRHEPPRRPGRPGRPDRPGWPDRPDRPGRPGYDQGYSCRVEDAGFEEHWGGHRSCGECLSRHGDCNVVCETEVVQWQCFYIGRDVYGRTQNFEYTDTDRDYAEYQARRQCERAGYRECLYNTCAERGRDRRVVSSRSCR